MNRASIVFTALVLSLSWGLSAMAASDLTRGQETFHKWVQVYDRQPDRVFVDRASIQAETKPSDPTLPQQAEATLMKRHEPSASVNGPTNRTEVNHVKVNCTNNTYSVRFQAEYMPNGKLTKSQTFDNSQEFQKPTSDTYFKEVIDFVCDQIKTP